MIFVKGDTAEYRGAVIGTGESLILNGDRVIVTEGNEDEDDYVTVVREELGGAAVPAFAAPGDLVWLAGA
jgi:hypothetical protein